MAHRLCLFLSVFLATVSAEVTFSGSYSRTISVTAGKAVEISVGLPAPSKLPVNGRIAVEWAGYRKVLHALDADFYMVYRPLKTGPLTLKISAVQISAVQEEEPIFNLARWREQATIANAATRLSAVHALIRCLSFRPALPVSVPIFLSFIP